MKNLFIAAPLRGTSTLEDLKKAAIYFDNICFPIKWLALMVSSDIRREESGHYSVGVALPVFWDIVSLYEMELEALVSERLISFDVAIPEISSVEKLQESAKRGSEAYYKVLTGLAETVEAELLKEVGDEIPERIIRGYIQIASMPQSFPSTSFLPVTNNRGLNAIMRSLWKAAAEDPKAGDILKTFGSPYDIRRGKLALDLLCENIPNFKLRSAEDVLEVRQRLRNELDAFRDATSKWATKVRSHPMDESFEDEMRELVEGEINPSLRELRKAVKLSGDKLILKTLKALPSVQSVGSLVASVYGGLPLSAGLAIAMGASVATAFLEAHFEKRELMENNGLSLLIEFP